MSAPRLGIYGSEKTISKHFQCLVACLGQTIINVDEWNKLCSLNSALFRFESRSFSKCERQIKGKSFLVQVSVRFE